MDGILCARCGEDLPVGARFCGACGNGVPSETTVACPLCRTEVPSEARFCGACGQPMRAEIVLEPESLSLPSQSAPISLPEWPFEEAGPAPTGPPIGGLPPAAAEDAEIDLAVDLDEADLHFRLVEVDALRKRGRVEEALALLQEAPLPESDARRIDRLAGIGTEMGRAAVERALSSPEGTRGLQGEVRRLSRLDRSAAYRDALAEELAPLAADEDCRRVRELLAEGHLHAALPLVEKIRSLGPRVADIRVLVHETIRAVVSKARDLQGKGDEAFRKGNRAAAEAAWTEALELLEDDRMLNRRLEKLRSAGETTPRA